MNAPDKRKPGRPAGRTQTALIRVYATPDELAALDAACGDRSRSDVMREALALWLKKRARAA